MLCCFLHLSLQLHETCSLSLSLHACILSFFFFFSFFFKNHTHAWRSRFLSLAVRYFSDCLPSRLHIYVRFSQLYPYPRPPPSEDYSQNQMMPNCFTSPQSGFPAEFTLSSTNCSSHRVHLSARLPPEKPPVNKPPSSSPAHFFSPISFLLQNWTSQPSHDAIRSQLWEL